MIGAGYNIFGDSHITVNTLGVQGTLANGFYIGVRTHINLARRNELESLKASFGGYVAIGYDFGKKINPKDYESRIR